MNTIKKTILTFLACILPLFNQLSPMGDCASEGNGYYARFMSNDNLYVLIKDARDNDQELLRSICLIATKDNMPIVCIEDFEELSLLLDIFARDYKEFGSFCLNCTSNSLYLLLSGCSDELLKDYCLLTRLNEYHFSKRAFLNLPEIDIPELAEVVDMCTVTDLEPLFLLDGEDI